MAAWTQVDPGGQPGQRVGDRVGDRQLGEPEGLAGQPVRDRPDPRWRRARRPAGRPRPRGSRRSRPSSGPRWPPPSPRGGPSGRRTPPPRLARIRPPLSGSASAGLAPWPRTSKVRQWKPAACRKTAIGRVRSRADSQPWTSTTPGPGCAVAGGNEPGRQLEPVRLDDRRLERQPEVGRGQQRRVPARVAGADPVGEGEPVGEPDRRRGHGCCDAQSANDPHRRRGRHRGEPVKWRRPVDRRPAGPRGLHSHRWPNEIRETCSASRRAPRRRRSRRPGGASPGPTIPT